jgi:hypothetical protein
VFTVPRVGDLYILQAHTQRAASARTLTPKERTAMNELMMLHKRLGHVAYSSLHQIIKQRSVDGLKYEVYDGVDMNSIINEIKKNECVYERKK